MNIWFFFLISLCFVFPIIVGEDIICENLPTNMCAFSISASGKRCLLETANVAGEYTCRTSAVEVEGIVNHVESDECVAACGVDRKTVGISSDAMMEAGFAAKICSPACLDYCPNILDLYFNLAAGEGTILSWSFPKSFMRMLTFFWCNTLTFFWCNTLTFFWCGYHIYKSYELNKSLFW